MADAATFLHAHHPAAALSAFDELLDAEPDRVEARAGRVRALWMLRRTDEALAELAAIEIHETVPEVHLARGMVALGLRDDPALLDVTSAASDQDLATAAAAFDRAADLDPSSVEAIRGRATALRVAGEYAAAVAVLDEALTRVGTRAPLLVERAQCFLDQWQVQPALDDLAVAAEAEPHDVEARLAQCQAWSTYGQHEEAYVAFERLRAEVSVPSPEIAEFAGWLELARIQEEDPRISVEGYHERARKAFEEVLASEPRHVGARCGLVQTARDTEGRTAALALIRSALADDPNSPQLLTELGFLLLDDATEADANHAVEHCFLRARTAAPYLVSAWEGLIYAATMTQRTGDAVGYLADMRQRFPDRPETMRTASYLAATIPDPASALWWADEAVKVAPHHPASAQQRSDALLTAGYHGEAADPEGPLAAAIERWPRNIGLRWQRMLHANAERRTHEALAECRTILGIDPRSSGAQRLRRQFTRSIRRRPLYWLAGRESDDAALELAAPLEERDAVDRYIADDDRLATKVALRDLAAREARLEATGRVEVRISLWEWLVAVGGCVVAALPMLGVLGQDGFWLRLLTAALAVGTYSLYWRVTNYGKLPTIGAVGLAALAVIVWAVTLDASGLQRFVWAVVAVPVVMIAVQLCVLFGLLGVLTVLRRRLGARLPHAVLLRQLVRLRSVLDEEPKRWDEPRRTEIMALLESIAQAQAQVVCAAAGDGPDLGLTRYANERARALAAATRDLKRLVVWWEQRTPAVLREQVTLLLDVAVTREWGRLVPEGGHEDEPEPSRWRARLRPAVWAATTLGFVAFVVWLLVISRTNETATMVTALTGLLAGAAPIIVYLLERSSRDTFGRGGRSSHATHAEGPPPRH